MTSSWFIFEKSKMFFPTLSFPYGCKLQSLFVKRPVEQCSVSLIAKESYDLLNENY